MVRCEMAKVKRRHKVIQKYEREVTHYTVVVGGEVREKRGTGNIAVGGMALPETFHNFFDAVKAAEKTVKYQGGLRAIVCNSLGLALKSVTGTNEKRTTFERRVA